MNAPEVMFVRVLWTAHYIPPFRVPAGRVRMLDLHVTPEPSYPFGRKGLVLASAWEQLGRNADGMLILDGDVVIDPQDFIEMHGAIMAEPAAVHVAPARIWPVSTGAASWSWGHWKDQRGQEWTEEPDYFAFNFTYLPAALMTACVKANMRSWRFPNVDMNVSRTAKKAGIPARVVKNCAPKHMHY